MTHVASLSTRRTAPGATVAVVGGGNAGHAVAGDLALSGACVRLLEHPREADRIAQTARRGEVRLSGAHGEAIANLDGAGTDVATLLRGAQLVLVAVPAFAHRTFADLTAPHIEPGATVVLFTGGFGALEWRRAALACGRPLDFVLAETNTLPYAARLTEPGAVRILGRAPHVVAAAFPGTHGDDVRAALGPFYPHTTFARDLLEPALRNVNGVIHPPAMLLNVRTMEAAGPHPWYVWRDGITLSVARLIEAVDAERRALAAAFGLGVPNCLEEQRLLGYGGGRDIRESLSQSPLLAEIEGPRSLSHRFFAEDVPYFLAPWLELAQLAGTDARAIGAVVDLACTICSRDWRGERRSLAGLGVEVADARCPRRPSSRGRQQSRRGSMKVGYIVYDDTTECEFVLVNEALGKVRQLDFPDPPSATVIGLSPRVIGWNGIVIEPDVVYREASTPDFDLLVIPGGQSSRRVRYDADFITWLRTWDRAKPYRLGVQRGTHPRRGGLSRCSPCDDAHARDGPARRVSGRHSGQGEGRRGLRRHHRRRHHGGVRPRPPLGGEVLGPRGTPRGGAPE